MLKRVTEKVTVREKGIGYFVCLNISGSVGLAGHDKPGNNKSLPAMA